ncbi:tRNA methyltransferase complex subunit Cpd1 [Chytridium lagenaria]|nr:tRNA methyltransferase complex subunit Cpd1 [Chytridium lagenaria]
MSFTRYTKTIDENDLVIAYMSPEAMTSLLVKRGEVYNNRFGSFHHSEMIGKPFGSRMKSHNKRGHIYLLHPTPELWTLVLPHRTQILYMPDISYISAQLGLRPGSNVIESGTGSGSFSHSIARTIAPFGELRTFEYHEQRAKVAEKDFNDHGLGNMVTVACRDVCKEGFGLTNFADAVFLDLPSPWEAVASAKAAMKEGKVGRLCSFSPCMEQIQRYIKMFEVLIRPYEVRKYQYKPLVPAVKPKEPKRRRDDATPTKASPDAKKVKTEKSEENAEEDVEVRAEGELEKNDDAEAKVENKRPEPDTAMQVDEPVFSHQPTKPNEAVAVAENGVAKKVDAETHHGTRPPSEIRGHTSYLLFASVIPEAASSAPL